MKYNLTAALFVFYIVIRFFFTDQVDAIHSYASYFLEILLVAMAAIIHREDYKKLWATPRKTPALISLLAGFVIYKLAKPLGAVIPFDLSAPSVWLFLLILAPILEELIFRFFAWMALSRLKPKLIWFATSILFSYAHLHAIWTVPPELYSFVVYQSLYTLGLGLACGYCVYKFRSLTAAIAVHFTFNLGFFVASL